MAEKIEKININNESSVEREGNLEGITHEVKKGEENNEQRKEELLQEIYKKSGNNSVKSESCSIDNNPTEEKIISNFIKECRVIGIKAIEKARKVLGPYGLDELHDRIMNDKKNSNK